MTDALDRAADHWMDARTRHDSALNKCDHTRRVGEHALVTLWTTPGGSYLVRVYARGIRLKFAIELQDLNTALKLYENDAIVLMEGVEL